MAAALEPGSRCRRVLAAAALALVATACGDASRGRVLLVGIDGATFRVIRPLSEAGRLPHLAALAREGVSGPLRAPMPLASPRIWNSIVTGKTPERHGITSFVRRDDAGKRRLLLSSDRSAHALWNIASDAGLTVGVVNFWNTFPPERIDGVMVSDHLLAGEIEGRRTLARAGAPPPGPLVFPDDWHARIAKLLSREDPVVDFPDPFENHQGLVDWLAENSHRMSRSFRDDALLTRIALEIDARVRPDLLLVLLPGIDRISHFLWGNLEPPERYPPYLRPTPSERAAGVAALEAYYEYTDALIGALLRGYGSDDLVVVLSDHGFEAGVGMGFLTGAHKTDAAREGVFFARGPRVPAGAPAGALGAVDVTPTILAWLGLPLGEDMDGTVAPFLEGAAVKTVPTHDTAPVERLAAEPSGAEEAIVEQLRQLGYVE